MMISERQCGRGNERDDTAEVGPWEKRGDDKEGNGTRATKRKRYVVILL
jgi:hypothetical protein